MLCHCSNKCSLAFYLESFKLCKLTDLSCYTLKEFSRYQETIEKVRELSEGDWRSKIGGILFFKF